MQMCYGCQDSHTRRLLRRRCLAHVRAVPWITLLFFVVLQMSGLMSHIRYYLYNVKPYLLFLLDYSRLWDQSSLPRDLRS
jgi:hypothetical protein